MCSDYSGLPVLKAITSASERGIHQLARCWIYSNEFQSGSDEYPFLFVNDGAATLSSSALGVAVIKDSVTRRKIQVLNHAGIYSFLVFWGTLLHFHQKSPANESPQWCATVPLEVQNLLTKFTHNSFPPRHTTIQMVGAALPLRAMARTPR